jgi:hypothetical protein
MCSIEEAWAGQTFNNYRVQSQADLRRKYMPISDDILTRNNEFSVAKKEPVSRMGNQGINTKMVRSLQVPQSQSQSGINQGIAGDNAMSVSFADNQLPRDNYGGLEPRPGYMSIYDNAGQDIPMPTQTQSQVGRSAFGDINQAFQVNPVVERFMARGGNSNTNFLLNENSNDDRIVLDKKFNSADTNTQVLGNTNTTHKDTADHQAMQGLSQIQASLLDILTRLERVERELHNGASRNMCDMVLYVLVGMLIAFILYSLLRK